MLNFQSVGSRRKCEVKAHLFSCEKFF